MTPLCPHLSPLRHPEHRQLLHILQLGNFFIYTDFVQVLESGERLAAGWHLSKSCLFQNGVL